MEFNEIWTKEKNDRLRQMIRENKSIDDIRSYFGKDLKYHPKDKYSGEYLTPYLSLLKNTEKSNKTRESVPEDIELSFTCNDHNYIIVLFYHESKIISYNILLTTQNMYKEYKKELHKLKSSKKQLSDIDIIKLSSIVDKETNYNEIFKLMGCVIYILLSFSPKYPISINQTNNKIKTMFWRNIIHNSIENIQEIKNMDNNGNTIYYYKLI